MSPVEPAAGFWHGAGFYQTPAECLTAVSRFVEAGRAGGDAVFLALPEDRLPRELAAERWPDATVADMREFGSNPARIISALQSFAGQHDGRRLRYLAEPLWPGRPAAQVREAVRHEALLNLAFGGSDARMLCLYDETVVPAADLADVRATHPLLMADGSEQAGTEYLGPGALPARLGEPLKAPARARDLAYDRDLRPVRALVEQVASAAGLSPLRCTDLVIAVSEVAANTLRYTAGGGVVRLWQTGDAVLCQIEDSGYIADALAGQRRPVLGTAGGQGLWLVNQVCDLAEIRTSERGTTIRLCMYRRPD